jgi:hypothetical protein
VAVEEQTFFDVTGDPGFRKYISGEIWLFGDLDRERLINIDRSSFNRECNDYRVAQRYLARSIVDFKSTNVQRPQREKVEVRRRIEDRLATIRAVEQVVAEAITLQTDGKGLPSSESGRGRISNRRMLAEELVGLGVEVVDGSEGLAPLRYTLDISEDGSRVRAALGSSLLDPNVEVGETIYRLVFAEGSPSAPPLAIRNRPREIVFNCSHPAHTGGAAKYQLSLALELAFLLEDPTDSAALYERMIGFIAAL